MKIVKLFIILSFAFILSCKKDDISHNYPDNLDYLRQSRAGNYFDKDVILYGANKDKSKENVVSKYYDETELSNSSLWKNSVEFIGSLFPIAIIDSNSGLISTEWYQEDENSNKRVKINAFVKGKELRKKNLRVLIFRQKRVNNQWRNDGSEDSDKSKSALTAILIRDKILRKSQQ